MSPLIINIIIGFVAVTLLLSMIIITPGKRAKIVEFLGKPNKKARMPGLSFKAPWPFAVVAGQVSLQLQSQTVNIQVKTSDNAFVDLPITVQYRVPNNPEDAVRAHYELDSPTEQIAEYVLNRVRSIAQGMSMEELYSDKDKVESGVKDELNTFMAENGYNLVNILVEDPDPGAQIREASNRVLASKREQEAAKNEAEAERIRLVGTATAEKESKELQGQGMAAMREAIAEGVEGSIKKLEAAGLTPQEAVALLMDTNRLDTIGSAAAHGNLVLLDVGQADAAAGSQMAQTIAAVKAAGTQSQTTDA